MSMRALSLLILCLLAGCQANNTQQTPSQAQSDTAEQDRQKPASPSTEPVDVEEPEEQVEPAPPVTAEPPPVGEEPAPSDPAPANEPETVGEDPITAADDSPAGKPGSDWTTFLGPGGNSKSTEKGALTKWPEAGLRIVWQKPLGTSYGIGSVSKGRYYQFDRTENTAHLDCLDAKTGKRLWQFSYLSDYEDIFGYDGGPRSSPVIDDDRVYLFGVEGLLHCLNTETGKVIWKVDTAKEFGFKLGITTIQKKNSLPLGSKYNMELRRFNPIASNGKFKIDKLRSSFQLKTMLKEVLQ